MGDIISFEKRTSNPFSDDLMTRFGVKDPGLVEDVALDSLLLMQEFEEIRDYEACLVQILDYVSKCTHIDTALILEDMLAKVKEN